MPSRRIVASFGSSDEARAAVVALERKGVVDANDVRIVGTPPIPAEGAEMDGDMKVANEHIRQYAIGGVICAVLFAAVAIAVVLVLDVEPKGLAIVFAALAAIPGFFIGGFWGVGRNLPVNDDAVGDTYRGDTGPVAVEVLIDHDVDADEVEAALRDLHPREIHLVA